MTASKIPTRIPLTLSFTLSFILLSLLLGYTPNLEAQPVSPNTSDAGTQDGMTAPPTTPPKAVKPVKKKRKKRKKVSCKTDCDCRSLGHTAYCDRSAKKVKQKVKQKVKKNMIGVCRPRRDRNRRCGAAITCFIDCRGQTFKSGDTCPGRPVMRAISCDEHGSAGLRFSSGCPQDYSWEKEAEHRLGRHLSKLYQCIDDAVADGLRVPSAQLVMKWEVNAEGRSVNTSILPSSIQDPKLYGCVKSVERRLRWPSQPHDDASTEAQRCFVNRYFFRIPWR